MQCGRDMLWAQGGNWGRGAPCMDALILCGSSSGPDTKSHLRPRGAKRGAGSVMGSRGGDGRARVPPQIRKPAPYQPYPHSRNPTGHPGQGCSRRVGGRTCVQAGRICLVDRLSNMISSRTRSNHVVTCTRSSARSVGAGWPAATTAHLAPTPKETLSRRGCAHPPQKRRRESAPSTRSGVANGPPGAAPCSRRSHAPRV